MFAAWTNGTGRRGRWGRGGRAEPDKGTQPEVIRAINAHGSLCLLHGLAGAGG